MISIGNDIVDLCYIDKARTSEPKFYTKFITPSELLIREQSDVIQIPFEAYVWMLWSIKESVYKFLKRYQPELVFSPTKISITNLLKVDDYYKGDVVFNDRYLYFKSVINLEFIVSVVDDSPDFTTVQSNLQKIERDTQEYQSLKVRELLLEKLTLMYPQQVFIIRKNQESGYPVVIQNGIDTKLVVSFAHHGYYVAYCFKL